MINSVTGETSHRLREKSLLWEVHKSVKNSIRNCHVKRVSWHWQHFKIFWSWKVSQQGEAARAHTQHTKCCAAMRKTKFQKIHLMCSLDTIFHVIIINCKGTLKSDRAQRGRNDYFGKWKNSIHLSFNWIGNCNVSQRLPECAVRHDFKSIEQNVILA